MNHLLHILSAFLLITAGASVLDVLGQTTACPVPTFEAGKTITLTGNAGTMASADFNNDGKKDFVVAKNFSPTSLGVLLGDGNGGFTEAASVSVLRPIRSISVADFNADGKLDVLISQWNGTTTNGVTLLSGDGTGQLVVVQTVLTGAEPGENVPGDFNQDDKMDFAVTIPTTNRVLVYYGDNAGNFAAPLEFLVGSTPSGIKTADFNADGRTDLVVANTASSFVSVLLGKSGGGFDQAFGVNSEPNLTASSVATGDVNNDGKADVIINAKGFSQSGGSVPTGASILLGNGTGGFTRLPFITFEWDANALWPADVNGDGKLDLIAFSSVATVRLGVGDGTFGPDIRHSTGGGSVFSLVVDDFNYDDKADLLQSGNGTDVHLFYGDSTGRFGARMVELGGRPNSVASADFSGDGKADAAFGNYDLSNISILINDGSGGLVQTHTVALPQRPWSVFSGDFNRDGKIDVGTINWNPDANAGGMSIALNNGNGFNAPALFYAGSRRFLRGAAVGDVNLDNKLDVVIAVVDSPGEIAIMLGGGDGFFAYGGSIRISPVGSSYTPWGVGIGDVNLDGSADIITSAVSSVLVSLSNSGTFPGAPTFFPVTNNAPSAELALADLNHDGKLDVIVSSNTSINQGPNFIPKLHVALGNGTGGFLPSVTYSTGAGTSSIAVGDLNNDTHLDVAVANGYIASGFSNRVGILYGDGTGALSPVSRFVAGYNAFDVGMADFDGDGRQDIVTPNYNMGTISILRNICPPAAPSGLPSLSIGPDSNINEGNKGVRNATFTVTLSTASTKTVKADFRTSPGTAGTRDYQPVSGTLTFQPGEVSKTMTIPVIGDLVNEPDEQLNLFLNNPLNASISDAAAVLTINEDTDPVPAVSIADTSVTEGNSGSVVAAFPVTLSGISGKPVTVNFAVSPGTATPKVDYDTFFGSVTIPPGTLSRIVVVTVTGDTLVEANETFSVTLSSPVNATLNRAQALGTIVNDDLGGTVRLTNSNVNVPEGFGTIQINVSRTGGSASDVAVAYSVGGGTATAGLDFNAPSGVLVFAANETSKTITVQIVNDTISEDTENLSVFLTGVTGGGTIAGSGVSINIDDDDPLPSLTVSDLQVAEGNNGTSTIGMTATLNNPSGRAVTVNFTPVPGTATAPSDYVQQSGTLSIPAGQTQGLLQLSVVGDLGFEPNESFTVTLSNPSGATLTRTSATITLINDDDTNRLFDFDGDNKADLAVFRSNGNYWSVRRDFEYSYLYQLGDPGDKLVPADYNGDSKTDVAVFRPSEGRWLILDTSTLTVSSVTWGIAGDRPAPSDRDGDGRADFVLYRESNNTWYTRFANNNFAVPTVFGEAGDKPVIGDFDGDRLGDIAVFRPSNNNWYMLKSGVGYFVQTWGEAGDIPTTGDFDGDGATDHAVFRPSTGQWYLSQTRDGFRVQNWGLSGDIPVAADYDGDGRADIAVFRPSDLTWYIINTTIGFQTTRYGDSGGVPIPSVYTY